MDDRLAEIERQLAEFGGGGEGTNIRWLLEEVKRLREMHCECEYALADGDQSSRTAQTSPAAVSPAPPVASPTGGVRVEEEGI